MFNELFLACLENHAPIRRVKKSIYHRGHKRYDERRDCQHQRARKMGTKDDLKAFRELQNRVKVVLRETERGNTITRKFTKIRTAARQFGKPFAALFQTRQVAQASKTQIHLLMNSITFLYLWERRWLVTLQSLPSRTVYQTFPSLLIFVHHRPVTSCLNLKQ